MDNHGEGGDNAKREGIGSVKRERESSMVEFLDLRKMAL
jgi:hypothetical protein